MYFLAILVDTGGNNDGGQQDFMRVQGSEHYPNSDYYA